MLYAEIAIEVAADDADRAAGALYEEGVAVEVRDHTTLLKPPPGRALLVVYSPPDEAAALAARVTALLAGADVPSALSREERDDGTWLDTWKAWFKPRPVGPFIIVPSWEKYEAKPGEVRIELDPGRAFGTGGHESTRLVLQLIGLERDRGASVERFLDVGCGSGILAIGCALLFPAATGLAIDVDSEAVATTRENTDDNHVTARIEASTRPLEVIEGSFGLVLANIQADVLERLASSLASRLGPGGRLVTSGILVEQGDAVEAAFARVGLARYERRVEGEWCAIGFERRAA